MLSANANHRNPEMCNDVRNIQRQCKHILPISSLQGSNASVFGGPFFSLLLVGVFTVYTELLFTVLASMNVCY